MFNLKSNFLNAYFLKFKCKKRKEKEKDSFFISNKVCIKEATIKCS